VKLIKEAHEAGTRLFKACEEIGISIRTYQRWTEGDGVKEDQRPLIERKPPANKLTNKEEEEILQTVKSAEYVDYPPSQIIPALADKGRYLASESTFYRILRKHELQKYRGGKRRATAYKRPTTHIAYQPNEVWSWDITWLNGPIKGMYYKLYMIIDIYSRKIVGWEVWESENAEYAKILVEKAVLKEGIKGKVLVLHADNGSPMRAEAFHVLLEKLNIQKSFSRPRVSNDNPFSESLFGTMKYRPEFPQKGFESLEKARLWVSEFVNWYNNIHKHSGLKFVTPAQRHTGQDKEILKKRHDVYVQAKKNRPERWSRSTRNWKAVEFVALNPVKSNESGQNGQEKNLTRQLS
jgi:putative transposase